MMRAPFLESAHLEPNTSRHVSHVSHHCTLDLPDWTEGTRVSPSRLPVVLHPCPSSSPTLLAVIASGLGTPRDSRKQRSHFTSWYTIAHSGDDDACFTPRRAYLPHLPSAKCPGMQAAHSPRICCPHVVVVVLAVAVSVAAPAAIAVLAVVALALTELILLGVPVGVADLPGVHGMVIGVAALLDPLLCAAVVLRAVLLIVVLVLLVARSGVLPPSPGRRPRRRGAVRSPRRRNPRCRRRRPRRGS